MNRWTKCKTQAQFDAAVRQGDWPEVSEGFFSASGSATVRASGSATVRASGSATVRAYDSATVSASDSATVSASDSATVSASDSATVSASGSATVRAYDSATVRASGSATVRAYDSATVSASKYNGVTRHGKRVKVTGTQHIVDVPDIETVEQWCDYYGVTVKRGIATLYKRVSADWVSDHGLSYKGRKVEASDWEPTNACGNGLHFSPRPHMTGAYSTLPVFIACPVKVADIVLIGYGIPDKVKAPRLAGLAYEVDVDGNRVKKLVSA